MIRHSTMSNVLRGQRQRMICLGVLALFVLGGMSLVADMLCCCDSQQDGSQGHDADPCPDCHVTLIRHFMSDNQRTSQSRPDAARRVCERGLDGGRSCGSRSSSLRTNEARVGATGHIPLFISLSTLLI